MTHKQFFAKLYDFYDGVDVNGKPYAVKYYLQATTFSYDIYQGEYLEDSVFFNLLGEPIFRSEVFYFWEMQRKEIIKHIETTLENI
jgi:hypothetical protein